MPPVPDATRVGAVHPDVSVSKSLVNTAACACAARISVISAAQNPQTCLRITPTPRFRFENTQLSFKCSIALHSTHNILIAYRFCALPHSIRLKCLWLDRLRVLTGFDVGADNG